MSHADSQQLAEAIDVSDFCIRTASELRLVNAGKAFRDQEAFTRSIECLNRAIAGGDFMTTGQSFGLHSTLRPLNWTADTFLARTANDSGSIKTIDYDQLSKYLRSLLATIECVARGNKPEKASDVIAASEFFQSLGDAMALRANQLMRPSSHTKTADNSLVSIG